MDNYTPAGYWNAPAIWGTSEISVPVNQGYTCLRCGALVAMDGLALHDEWHLNDHTHLARPPEPEPTEDRKLQRLRSLRQWIDDTWVRGEDDRAALDWAIELAERELGSEDVFEVELVKGGDLRVLDHVFVECKVYEINSFNHVRVRPLRDGHWMAGDQYLTTWGGPHGAGKDVGPTIMRKV